MVGLVASFAVLAIGTLWATRAASKSEAIKEAERLGELTARGALGSAVTDDLLAGDPAAIAKIDAITQGYKQAATMVRVKVWSGDGTIVYSDEPRLIGQRFDLSTDDQNLVTAGGVEAEITNLTDPENVFERQYGTLLQVYVGHRTIEGTPVLVESYFPYALVQDTATALRDRYLPVFLGGLVLLTLAQVPLALSLAARLQRNQQDREHLLQRLLDTSDAERRRIAGEVHDGAVQDLIGIGFALGGVAEQTPEPQATKLRNLSAAVSTTVRQLRSLLSSVYPVELPLGGLVEGVADLVEMMESQGTAVRIVDEVDRPMAPSDELLMLRAARELLRNVMTHANARSVTVRLRASGERVVLEVDDDGEGFSPEQLETRQGDGHFGLRLLGDLVADAGGNLDMTSAPGQGTQARLELVSP
jgi:signal transduction histidine kinase